MLVPVLPWLVGGIATLLVLGGGGRRDGGRRGTRNDLDALASMLIAETGFARSQAEMAQIVWVAVNRARKYGKPIYEIVSPAGRRPAWNTGALYKKRFDAASANPRWDAARSFASKVIGGAYRNIGATTFVHPRAMPTPPCAPNRTAMSTSAGTRCLPDWIADGRQVGGALFA